MTNRISKQKKKDWADDPEVMVFGRNEVPSRAPFARTLVADDTGLMLKSRASDLGPELPLQGAFEDRLRGLFGVNKDEVRTDWRKVVGQIRSLLDGVSAATKNYELDEITFELGFSGEGKIVFVANASVTTSISATFKRRKR